MNLIKQKYEANKSQSWALFGYLVFSLCRLRLPFRYVLDRNLTLSELPKGLDWLATPYGSLVFWGIMWGIGSVMGILAVIQGFLKEPTYWLFASIVTSIGLHIVWGGSYAAGWLLLGGRDEWLTMLNYGSVIGLLIGFASGSMRSLRETKKAILNNTLEK